MPSELGTAIGLTVIGLGALFVGAEIYSVTKTGKSLWENFTDFLNKDKKNNTKEEIEKLPTVAGAKNQSIMGKPIPLTLGSHLLAPYYCGNPFLSIDGEDGENQYYTMALCCGYKDINIDHIKMGNIEIATNRNENGTVKADGEITTSVPCDTDHPLSKNGDITIQFIKGDRDSSLYSQKINDESFGNTRLMHLDRESALEVNTSSALCPQKIEVQIDIPALIGYKSDGTKAVSGVNVKCFWSLDEKNWNTMYFEGGIPLGDVVLLPEYMRNSTRINRAKPKEMRFVATKEFSYSELFDSDGNFRNKERVVYIKVYKSSTDFETPSEIDKDTIVQEEDKVYLTNIRTWVFDYEQTKTQRQFVPQRLMDKTRMEMTSRLVMKIKATESTKNYFDSVSCTTHSLCPIYKGNGEWGGKVETSNPASIVKMLMEHPMLGANKIEDDKIDLFALGNIYNYCEKPYQNSDLKFECNSVLTSQEKLLDVVKKVLNTARAYLTRNGSRYSFFIDKRQNVPSCILNNHNILKDGLTNTKSFNTRIDGVRISFINKNIGYQKDTIVAYRNGKNENDTDLNLTDIELDYVTDPVLAWKFARFELAKLQLRPETWVRKVGTEGNIFNIGNLLTLQDDTLLVGLGNGGVVTDLRTDDNGNIIEFKVDTKLEISDTSKTYGVTIQHSSETSDILISTVQIDFENAGYFDVILPHSPISANEIAVGDLVSFGEFGKISTDVICVGKTRDSDGNFACTFLPYSNEIFEYDEGELNDIPDFNSNVTEPSDYVYEQEPPQRSPVNIDELNDVKDYVNEEITKVVLDATPIYTAELNTTVIKKGNDGSYSPRTLSGEGLKKTGDSKQELYSGKWHFYLDEKEIEEESVEGSTFTKDVKYLIDTYGDFGSIKVEFTPLGNKNVLIDRMNIPILTGQAQYSVVLSNPFQTYEVDENGFVSERTVQTKARVFYGLKELEYLAEDGWQYGIINYDKDVFDVSIDFETGIISITSLAGDKMPVNGEIEIPIFIHSNTNTEVHIGYVEGMARAVEEIYIGYGQTEVGYLLPDENGYYYQYFTFQKLTETSLRLNNISTKLNKYWGLLTDDLVVTVAERNTLERLFQSITAEYNAYSVFSKYGTYAKYENAYEELSDVVNEILDFEYTEEEPYKFKTETAKNDFNKKFENYYSAKAELDEEYSKDETNFTGVDTLAKIPTHKKPNDYFVWTGEKNKIGNTDLVKGMVYCWNGTEWVEDNSTEHSMVTMNEALSVLAEAPADSNVPAVSFAKRLIALKVITDELYSNFASIKNLQAGNVVIGGYKDTEKGEVQKFITESDVDKTITDKGYQTESDVNETIESKGYQTSDDVTAKIKVQVLDDFDEKVANTKVNGKTLIEGGYVNTEVIEVNEAFMEKLATKILNLKEGGVIKADNWNGEYINKGLLLNDFANVEIGDYFEFDGVYNFVTSKTSQSVFEYVSKQNKTEPVSHLIKQSAMGTTSETIQSNKTVKVHYHLSYMGTTVDRDYIVNIGDIASMYDINPTYKVLWTGENWIPTNKQIEVTTDVCKLITVENASIDPVITKKGTKGFIQLSNGKAEFNDEVYASNMHIGGNSVVEGEVNATKGVFSNVTINRDCEVLGSLGTVTNINGKTYNYGEQTLSSLPPMGEFSEIVVFYSMEKSSAEWGFDEHQEVLGVYLISWYLNVLNMNNRFQQCTLIKLYEPVLRTYVSIEQGTYLSNTKFVKFTNPSTNANNCRLAHLKLN